MIAWWWWWRGFRAPTTCEMRTKNAKRQRTPVDNNGEKRKRIGIRLLVDQSTRYICSPSGVDFCPPPTVKQNNEMVCVCTNSAKPWMSDISSKRESGNGYWGTWSRSQDDWRTTTTTPARSFAATKRAREREMTERCQINVPFHCLCVICVRRVLIIRARRIYVRCCDGNYFILHVRDIFGPERVGVVGVQMLEWWEIGVVVGRRSVVKRFRAQSAHFDFNFNFLLPKRFAHAKLRYWTGGGEGRQLATWVQRTLGIMMLHDALNVV